MLSEEEQVQRPQWECLGTSKVVGEAGVEGVDEQGGDRGQARQARE